MFKNYMKLISLYKNKSFQFFKNTKKDRRLIHEYEWDNVDINCSMLFEIELFSMDIYGYANSLTEDNFSRVEEALSILTKKSIYDNEIILNWLTEENINKYPDYYIYILFLENYRILVIKTCEEYEKINKCQSNN